MDFDLDLFADTVPEPASSNAKAGGKFQPNSRARPKKGTPSTLPTSFTSASKETPVITACSNDVPAVKSVTPINNLQNSIYSLSHVDPGEGGSIDSIHVSVNDCIIGQCAILVEDPSSELIGDAQIYLNESFDSTFHPDGSLDFSTMGFSETAPSDHPPELMVTEEVGNLVEASQPDVVTSITSEKVEDLQASGETSKRGTRKKQGTVEEVDSQNFEQPSQRDQDQRPASTAVEENEASKSSRRRGRRKFACVPAEEGDNGIGESENFHKEASHYSDLQRDEERDDVEYRVTDMSTKTRAPRKLKKHAPENDEAVQRHKKSSEGQDPSDKKLKKRFSHSTKRKRRIVDKVLLETPEDEINPQKLAEAKEKLLNKDEAASKKSLPNRSADNSVPYDASHNEDESANEEATEQLERGLSKLNYHPFMDRTPSERWSKQDTEQFYEAIRQFGTDFAMIQQLFPGRTRHQVKLKFKKEERQHPLRVSDALTTHSKDHSHFEIIIQQLQAAAQAEKNDSDVDVASVAMTNEEQVLHEENEEVAKSDQKVEEEEEENNLELNVPEVCNTAAFPDKDDFSRWSDYKGADFSP